MVTPPLETHTLLASAHVERYLVLLRSLAAVAAPVAPVIHDDGTLTRADEATIRAEAADARIVWRADADAAADEALRHHPGVRSLRRHNLRISQLVDYHLFTGAPRMLGIDSDVVFLRRPDELLDWAAAPAATPPVVLYSPENGWQPKGIHWLPAAVPDRPYVPNLCCGIVAADVVAFADLDYLEELVMRTDPDVRGQQRYVTQMYYALMCGRLPGDQVQDLGERYRSGRLEWLPEIEDRVLCHYFGSHDAEDALADLWRRRPDVARAVAR
jgi:hypothetical protein